MNARSTAGWAIAFWRQVEQYPPSYLTKLPALWALAACRWFWAEQASRPSLRGIIILSVGSFLATNTAMHLGFAFEGMPLPLALYHALPVALNIATHVACLVLTLGCLRRVLVVGPGRAVLWLLAGGLLGLAASVLGLAAMGWAQSVATDLRLPGTRAMAQAEDSQIVNILHQLGDGEAVEDFLEIRGIETEQSFLYYVGKSLITYSSLVRDRDPFDPFAYEHYRVYSLKRQGHEVARFYVRVIRFGIPGQLAGAVSLLPVLLVSVLCLLSFGGKLLHTLVVVLYKGAFPGSEPANHLFSDFPLSMLWLVGFCLASGFHLVLHLIS